MLQIHANDLKKHGISLSCEEEETLVLVRGRPAFVILSIERYESLNEAALLAAVDEARADYQEGRYVSESVKDHIERITD